METSRGAKTKQDPGGETSDEATTLGRNHAGEKNEGQDHAQEGKEGETRQRHSPPALLLPSVTTLPAGHFAARPPGSATDSESERCSSAAAGPPEGK